MVNSGGAGIDGGTGNRLPSSTSYGGLTRVPLYVTWGINRCFDCGYRTDNNQPLVTSRFLNLSSFLDLSPGVFIKAISSRC